MVTTGTWIVVSFGTGESEAAVRGWKAHPEFRDRAAEVLRHVDDFPDAELEVVSEASDGTGSVARSNGGV